MICRLSGAPCNFPHCSESLFLKCAEECEFKGVPTEPTPAQPEGEPHA